MPVGDVFHIGCRARRFRAWRSSGRYWAEDDVLPDHAGETYRGREGVVRAARTWLEAYEQFAVELEQIVGSGDRLVSIHRFRGKGRHSGIEDGGRYAYLWTFRDAKVIHFVSFRDPVDALEAVGVRE